MIPYLFIHIPKTGGSSIRKALPSLPQMQHNKAKYQLPLPSFSFAFVRNPWDRILSYYCMTIRTSQFDQAAWDRLLRQPIDRQTEFICDDHGKVLVDFIGRFENLQEDFNVVCQKIGIEARALYFINTSTHDHYRNYYDDASRQFIAERYADEIERFGYSF
jgi:hypothetical protein